MSESDPLSENSATTRLPQRRRALMAGIAIAVLVVGAAAGAGGTRLAQRWQPQGVMLLQPVPVIRMQDGSPVAVKGNVAEIFGNKFIVQDESGRALVDLGPRGELGDAVAKNETVSVQGRFDRGVIHAQIVSHADGRSEAFGPPGPPGPPRPDRGPAGPRADRGPDRGPPPPPPEDRGLPQRDAPPPPPPSAQ
jgi:uncharacterized protein YdeI (BOF family)